MTTPVGQDRIKQVVQWISDMALNHPEKGRPELLKEAERRFDLTPKECLFIERNFNDTL